jgi:hypothetical protein
MSFGNNVYYPAMTPIIPTTTNHMINKQFPVLPIYQPMNQNQQILSQQYGQQEQ